jgi:ubiquinone/menaquinone biosynthesis C-methylase UbiE
VFSNPEQNVTQFEIDPGSTVVDFGVGSGDYALAIAKKIGSSGKVYGIDIQKDLLTKLKKHAAEEGITNLEVLHTDLENENAVPLTENIADVCIVSNILFQIEEKEIFFTEVTRLLKPGGRVFVIDWSESFKGMGPNEEHLVSPEQVNHLAAGAGLTPLRELQVGAYHFGNSFKKS